jgi:hypothetical protein
MAKEEEDTQPTKSDGGETTDAGSSIIPEDILEYKKKLEAKTGKKYKYRPAKNDLPSVGELLKHGGVPGQQPPDDRTKKTWKETLGLPVALAIVFALNLFMVHYFILSRSSNVKPLKLPSALKKNRPVGVQLPAATNTQQQQQRSAGGVDTRNEENPDL